MKKTPRAERRFAICIKSDDSDLLTPRKVYEVLRDSKAEKCGFIRVIDNEGEDYLYASSYFVFISLPAEVSEALRQAS
jgi:hypothetical protein